MSEESGDRAVAPVTTLSCTVVYKAHVGSMYLYEIILNANSNALISSLSFNSLTLTNGDLLNPVTYYSNTSGSTYNHYGDYHFAPTVGSFAISYPISSAKVRTYGLRLTYYNYGTISEPDLNEYANIN